MVSIDSFDAIRLETSRCNECSPPDKPKTNDIEMNLICRLKKENKSNLLSVIVFVIPK